MAFTLRLEKKINKNGEYVVVCRKNGEYYEPGSYHTSDWSDAIANLKSAAIDLNLKVKKIDGVYVAK